MNADKVMAALHEMDTQNEGSTEELVKVFYEQVAALNQTIAVINSEGLVVSATVFLTNADVGEIQSAERILARVFEPL
jgi:hypothetical protein